MPYSNKKLIRNIDSVYIIADKNKKSLRIKNILTKKIEANQFKKFNLVIVIGGDGFMLQTLKKIRIQKSTFMELTLEIMDF